MIFDWQRRPPARGRRGHAAAALLFWVAGAACAPDSVPEHGLGGSSIGMPGTLGNAGSGAEQPAVEDAGGTAPGGEPDVTGALKVIDMELPFEEGVALRVATDEAASSGAYGPHYVAFEAEAIDELVLATRSGTVTAVNDAYVDGGPSPDAVIFTNTIIVESPDGVRTEYLHLHPATAAVAVGAKVTTGAPLARAGNTGYALGRRIGVRASRSGVPAPLCFRTTESDCDGATPGSVLESTNPGG